MANRDLPVTIVATVTFQSYDPDGEHTMQIDERIRRCIETHPTLSFVVDDVTSKVEKPTEST